MRPALQKASVTAGLRWAPETRPNGEIVISATQGATKTPTSRKRVPGPGSAPATGESAPNARPTASRITHTSSAVPAASASQARPAGIAHLTACSTAPFAVIALSVEAPGGPLRVTRRPQLGLKTRLSASFQMPSMPTASGLFEAHLTVRDLDRSVAFYRDAVGLELALQLPERAAAFFWVGG